MMARGRRRRSTSSSGPRRSSRGFLLGYVAMLPLIGRIADLRGRVPVLVAALVVFAVGSLVTAAGLRHAAMVAGRFLQGVGGGGLVPATLALVADLYPVERRGVPLGVVSARPGARLACSARCSAPGARGRRLAGDLRDQPRGRAGARGRASAPLRRDDRPTARSAPAPARLARGRCSCSVTLVAGALVFVQPPPLMRDLTWGRLFIPFAGDGRWLTPVGVVAIVAARAVRGPLLHRAPPAGRPARLGPQRRARPTCVGALLLAVALGGVILAFATADPEVAGLLRPGPLVPPRRARSPPSRFVLAPAPRRGAAGARAARCAVRRRGGRCWSASSSARR